jgi:hypothetical protein
MPQSGLKQGEPLLVAGFCQTLLDAIGVMTSDMWLQGAQLWSQAGRIAADVVRWTIRCTIVKMSRDVLCA